MGLIRAFTGALGGTFADQWKDFIVPSPALKDQVLLAPGVMQTTDRRRNANVRGSGNVITNGSRILVPEGVAALTVQNGAITGLITQPGGYVFSTDEANSQSLFADDRFSDVVRGAWERFTFGGQPGVQQRVVYVNLKEIAGLKYGTQNPIRYRDANYNNIMLAVTSFGNYSIRIVDPIAFYRNFVPADAALGDRDFALTDSGATATLFAGFVGSLAAALSAYTKGGKSIDDVQAGTVEFAQALNEAVEAAYGWRSNYGIAIVSVQPRGLDWDEPSAELVNKFNLGAMMQGNIGNAYAQAAVADGLNAAGHSGAGAAGMMGVGMAGGMVGGFLQQQPTAPVQPVAPTVSAAPAAPAPVADDPMAALTKLKALFENHLISEAEFEAKKSEILARL